MELFFKASDMEEYDTMIIKDLKKYITIEESDILSVEDLFSMLEEMYYECERLTEIIEDKDREIENILHPEPQYEYSDIMAER